MKPATFVCITAHENSKGQVFWIGMGVAVLLLLFVLFLADTSHSFQSRMLETGSYFLCDLVAFLTATWLGSAQYSRDFSNRGLAELCIPAGISRESLLAWRLAGQAFCLAALCACLGVVRLGAVLVMEHQLTSVQVEEALVMFLFAFLKSCLALTAAAFMGTVTRPLIAVLAVLGLFALGHFGGSVSGVQGIAEDQGGVPLSPIASALFSIFRFWNPNLLVLDSFSGTWDHPDVLDVCARLLWGLCGSAFFLLLSFLALRKRDIGAFQL